MRNLCQPKPNSESLASFTEMETRSDCSFIHTQSKTEPFVLHPNKKGRWIEEPRSYQKPLEPSLLNTNINQPPYSSPNPPKDKSSKTQKTHTPKKERQQRSESSSFLPHAPPPHRRKQYKKMSLDNRILLHTP